ncbi:hypothetical protein MASR2M15_03560 [Anaerolineales bacterium]
MLMEEPPNKETGLISEQSMRYKYFENRQYAKGTPASLNPLREVIISIRGLREIFYLSPDIPLRIGRFDLSSPSIDFDLSVYGAEKLGVSRLHAKLELDRHHNIYLTDMGSTNGTRLAGNVLRAYQPNLVKDGDEILLGFLLMTIYLTKPQDDLEIGV